jgi:hypothetical protein
MIIGIWTPESLGPVRDVDANWEATQMLKEFVPSTIFTGTNG